MVDSFTSLPLVRKKSKKRKAPAPKTASERPGRKNNPEATKQNILAVATKEFARHGFSGGRVDAIAAKIRTTKRMIYYYFGSKEGLYIAVLEKVYADIREIESDLHLEDLEPVEAIQRLIEFTFDYDETHPDFIRLVSIENIHRADHLKKSATIGGLNQAIIETIAAVLERGKREGVFRSEIDPVDLHMLISAFCLFRVSNRHTFGAIFRQNFSAGDLRRRHKQIINEAVLSLLKGVHASKSKAQSAARRQG
jgi:AcrR family transcriptional regulator